MANDKSFKIKNGLSATRYLGTNGTETAATDYYSLASASYDSKTYRANTQVVFPTGLDFSTDGTKMYLSEYDGDVVYQYTLSTAWDVSTASYANKSFDATTQDTSLYGLFLKSDGSKMFTLGNTNDSVYQYSLSTAWDISTVSYDNVSFSFSSQETSPYNLHFKSDGTSMFVIGGSNDTVYQYTLSTAWNVSTASYANKSFSVSSQESVPFGLEFNSSGTEMFICGQVSDKIHKYNLSTAWDVSTASLDSVSFDLSSQGTTPRYIHFKPDGSKVYTVDGSNTDIYQYSTVAYTQTLDLSTGHTFSITPTAATDVLFSNPPATGVATGFTVEVNNSAGGYAITWPSSVKWHLGTAPTATASKEVYTFITTDGGTTYYGKKAGENLA